LKLIPLSLTTSAKSWYRYADFAEVGMGLCKAFRKAQGPTSALKVGPCQIASGRFARAAMLSTAAAARETLPLPAQVHLQVRPEMLPPAHPFRWRHRPQARARPMLQALAPVPLARPLQAPAPVPLVLRLQAQAPLARARLQAQAQAPLARARLQARA
jgi:hypothetical protein